MRASTKEFCKRILTLCLAVLLVVGMVPFGGIKSLAAPGKTLKIQVLEDGEVSTDNLACTLLVTGESSDYSGNCDDGGIWDTGILLSDVDDADSAALTVGSVSFEPELANAKEYLIVDIAKKTTSFSDTAVLKIKSVSALTSVTVNHGATVGQIENQLPGSVKVVLSDGSTATLEISSWSLDGYKSNQVSAQTFDAKGTLKLIEGIRNPEELKATVSVTVKSQTAVLVAEKNASTKSVAKGAKLELTAKLTEGDPEEYNRFQWFKDSTKVSGATKPTYTVNAATMADAGEYYCRVSNADNNSVNSNHVTVTVTESKSNGLTLTGYRDAVAPENRISGSVSRPCESVTLEAAGYPTDGGAMSFTFTVNGKQVQSSAEPTYVLPISDKNNYDCSVKVSFEKNYEDATASFSFSVGKSEQTLPVTIQIPDTLSDGKTTYTSDAAASKHTIKVAGGNGTGAYRLEIKDAKDGNGKSVLSADTIATVTKAGDNWTLQIKGAGTFLLVASRAGDANYNESDETETSITVEKSQVSDFSFTNPNPEAIVYNTNHNQFENAAASATVSTGVTYEIVSGADVAVLPNPEMAVLNILKAGVVTVKATLAADKNHNAASAQYSLEIKKANQTVKFDEGVTELYYGQTAAPRTAVPVKVETAADGYGYNHDADVAVKYSIQSDPDGVVASVDAASGAVTFADGKVGTFEMKATLAGNNCYNEASASYQMTVKPYEVQNGYTLEGDKTDEANAWYISDVTVKPAEGFMISTSNHLGNESDPWKTEIVISDEGETNGLVFYLKNVDDTEGNSARGAISTAIEIPAEQLKIDKSNPVAKEINYKTSAWYQDVLESVTFGYYNSTVEFVLVAKDSVSGISGFRWSYHDLSDEVVNSDPDAVNQKGDYAPTKEDILVTEGISYNEEDGTYSVTCMLGDESNMTQYRGNISFVAIDNAGLESEQCSDNYVIVIDTQAPELEIKTNAELKERISSDPWYASTEDADAEVYAETLTVQLSILETNFFENRAEVTVNGEKKNVTWTSYGHNRVATFDLTKDGIYRIALTYTDGDKDGTNEVYTAEKTVILDTTAPEITILLSTPQNQKDGVSYYNETATATVKVTEAWFRPADLKAETLEGFIGLTDEQIRDLQNPDSWTQDGETFTTTLSFETGEGKDGNYQFGLSLKDPADNMAQTTSSPFILDTVDPELAIATGDMVAKIDSTRWYAASENEDAAEVFDAPLTATLTVTETNFFADRAVLKVNGTETPVDWTDNSNDHVASFAIENDGLYELELVYTDLFGEPETEYAVTRSVILDTTAPEIDIQLSDPVNEKNDLRYYDAQGLTATVTVHDAWFRPADLTAAAAEGFRGLSDAQIAALQDTESWTVDESTLTYTAVIELAPESETDPVADGNYQFTLSLTDPAGNAAQPATSDPFVVDTTAPVVNFAATTYDCIAILDPKNQAVELTEENVSKVTVFGTETVTMTVAIDETNFDPDAMTAKMVEGDKEKDLSFDGNWEKVDSLWINHITVNKQGTYTIVISGMDLAKNRLQDFVSPRIEISDHIPSITTEIVETPSAKISTYPYYTDEELTLIVRVFDSHFDPAQIVKKDSGLTVSDLNKNKEGSKQSVGELEMAALEYWTWVDASGDAEGYYQKEIKIRDEGRYQFALRTKAYGQDDASAEIFFVLDRTAPTIEIGYSMPNPHDEFMQVITFNFYQTDVELTVTATDEVAGVAKLDARYLRDSDASTVNTESWDSSVERESEAQMTLILKETIGPQLRGHFSAMAVDNAGNSTESKETQTGQHYENNYDAENKIIVDDISPVLSVSYQYQKLVEADAYHKDTTRDGSLDDSSKVIIMGRESEPVIVTFDVEEANFFPEDIKVTKYQLENGKRKGEGEAQTLTWEDVGDHHQASITLTEDGDYDFNVEYTDRSSNEMNYYSASASPDDQPATVYNSPEIRIDNTVPLISHDLDYCDFPGHKDDGRDYHTDGFSAVIKIQEHTFRPEDYEFHLLKAMDIGGNEIETAEKDGVVYNPVKQDIEEQFYNSEWTHDDPATKDVIEADPDIHYLELKFDKDAIYQFSVSGKDAVENPATVKYEKTINNQTIEDEWPGGTLKTNEFVVDKTRPDNLRIEYSVPKLSKVLSTITFNYYKDEVTVTLYASDSTSGVKRFDWEYNASTIKPNDSKTHKSYERGTLPVDGDPGREASSSFKLKAGKDQYRGNISFTATDYASDAVSGTLSSGIYQSGVTSEPLEDKTVLVVDNISPTRTVKFDAPSQIIDGSGKTIPTESYNLESEDSGVKLIYDGQAMATITVTEANFYDEDIKATINDKDVKIPWKQSESNKDVWTGTVTFAEGDGHYKLNLKYKDRSTNEMKEYTSNEIIVDNLAPEIKVTYSPANAVYETNGRTYYNEAQTATITITEHNFRAADVKATLKATDINGATVSAPDVASQLANESAWSHNGDVHTATVKYDADANYDFGIAYEDLAHHQAEAYKGDQFAVDTGAPKNLTVSYSKPINEAEGNSYYKEPVTVTVHVSDDVSGIAKITYSYVASDDAINSANVVNKEIPVQAGNGASPTLTFQVPGAALNPNNQFKGTVKVFATDNSGNRSAEFADKKMLVVDNVAPVSDITLSSPVMRANGKAYYSSDAVATIRITEANFRAEDVIVRVNGQAATPSWSGSGAEHTGTVAVSADGEYKITVDYKDLSENAMPTYESETFVIDHTKPTISVSGVAPEKAYKDETVGFTVRAEDANFNPSAFKPTLTVVVQNEDKQFETRTIELGAPRVIDGGRTYAIAVENLTDDGIYTLTCNAADLCGNTNNVMSVADAGNAQVSSLTFSINRKGSTFNIDETTKSILENEYFIQSVDHDIVITETNVDPLTGKTVTLNGVVLTEGKDYSVQESGGNGKWYTYTYTIFASNFAEENEYKLVIKSEDASNSSAYSDLKDADVTFVVDKTPPIVVVSGMEKNGKYETDKQTVTIVPTDDGGKLASLKVMLNGEVLMEYAGDELQKILEENNGILTFEIPEGTNQRVQIVCTDKAGNVYDSEDTYGNITVSPNKMVLLWASKPFRAGVIGGSSAIGIGGLALLIFLLKKKKKQEEEK